jgi:hypothetical protein
VYITLRTYDNYINANLALGKLLDGGIHAFLQDEHTVTVDPLLSLAINGIKLVVPEQEARLASAMIGIMEDEYKHAVECPACTSTEVEWVPRPAGLVDFLKGVVKWLFKGDSSHFTAFYRCTRCGCEFDYSPSDE